MSTPDVPAPLDRTGLDPTGLVQSAPRRGQPALAVAVPITPPADQPPGGPAHIGVTLRVSVHNGHCHLYGVCQQEAPEVFHLRSDTRLKYDTTPPAEQSDRVRQAARLCPMQAITVETR